ncbi:MAG: hypothetical protein SGPRY_003359 [Prymnesium sp.]
MLHGVGVRGSPFRCYLSEGEELPALAAYHASVARGFRANALSWDADTASAWEAHRAPCKDYIQHKLSRPGLPVALGVEMANTWRLSGVDPYSYEQKQLQECEGGIAGSRGRYAARKRTAMLHNRLTAMSEQLDPDWHPTKALGIILGQAVGALGVALCMRGSVHIRPLNLRLRNGVC